MERYDRLYRLYEAVDTGTLQAYQDFVDLFPPMDGRPALAYWEQARAELDRRREVVAETVDGEAAAVLADVASYATRDQAFTALDLLGAYGRAINVLVLDVDETLRSAGGTDNEIPRETLHLLTIFQETGVPIVICTGQTLENVKGFLIQGLGNELVHGGDLSVVYEAGTGVFTPGQGQATKALLYEDLDETVRSVFDRVRSRVLPDAPEPVRRGCHLQGNEFNVTLKPNFETGSERARAVIARALDHELAVLERAVCATLGDHDADGHGARGDLARAFYAESDPEIEAALEGLGTLPDVAPSELPEPMASLFARIDVAYYEADAAEIGSRELNKVVGVERALETLGVEDPFALVMGDSKSDLRVMRWLDERDAGLAAAPAHASPAVLEHVASTDELVFDRGDAAEPLRVVYALNRLAEG